MEVKMKVKIVADSCCDLNKDIENEINIKKVPLTIRIDDKELKDDKNLNIKELLNLMKKSHNYPQTASPSPQIFLKEYQGEESVFVVTLSSKLSSSYNNAVLAKKMALEKGKEKFIHVFDSLSASIGETLVGMKTYEFAKHNYKEIEIVEKINDYIKNMKTIFLLESLDNLVKAGRINKLVGNLSSILSIKLIMGGADNGTIKLIEKVRGAKKSFKRLVEIIGEKGDSLEEKILGIAHCNAKEKAEELKKEIVKRYNFKDVIIVETSGISTVYAGEGGIVIAF
jgi:DegV family protein with EDD domain